MGKSLYAVGNRTHEKAVAFAEKYGVSKVYDSIDDMFLDPDVDIIYITSPHNTHYAFMKQALMHGKHLLVEKSITLNSRELDDMIALAKEKKLVLAEAMTIWHMPIYKKLWDIVQSGELGKVQIITMNFGSFKEYDMSNRFFKEQAVKSGDASAMQLAYSKEVMEIMTKLRKDWGMKYPGEVW